MSSGELVDAHLVLIGLSDDASDALSLRMLAQSTSSLEVPKAVSAFESAGNMSWGVQVLPERASGRESLPRIELAKTQANKGTR
jgi:hypothetical protein